MDINSLIKSLKKGNNPEQNLSLYGNMLAGSYSRISAYQLAMGLTEFYDEVKECGDEACQSMLEAAASVLKKLFLSEDTDIESLVNTTDRIRNQLVENIKDLEAYTYFLKIYEHIFNRIEYGFKEAKPVDAAKLAEEAVLFADTGDAASSNERIQTVMGELPVRMTMLRFSDMVKRGCACYTGVRSDMADRFFEYMADCARPLKAALLNSSIKALYEAAETFEAWDLNNVDEDGCKEAMVLLAATTDTITEALMPRLYLAEIVNPLYIYLLTQNYVLAELPDMKKAKAAITEFLNSEAKDSFLTPDEDIVGILTELTKKQEKLTGEHMLLENAFYEIVSVYPDQIDGLALNGMYNSLYCCSRIFNEGALSAIGPRKPYFSVDAAWIDAKTAALEKHYETVLSEADRTVKRAQMAEIIGALPVIFDSLDDFGAYVESSFSSCTDKTEKAASAALLRELMEDIDQE